VPSVHAEDDFSRARRRYVLDRLGDWLRREPGQVQLLRFDEVVSALGFRGEYYLGPRTIRLDTSGRDRETRGASQDPGGRGRGSGSSPAAAGRAARRSLAHRPA
jgi:hypothetical protein